MNETALYPTIKKVLLECGCAVTKIPGSTYNQGLPDFIATFLGHAIHIEVKLDRPKRPGKVTELQLEHLQRHAAARAMCGVLRYETATKIWRLDEVLETGLAHESRQLTVVGHVNLGKLLAHFLNEKRRQIVGI